MSQRRVDEKYMRRALSLAKKGLGRTSPNPAVGALLVKDGRILASAYHKKAGSMHAEALAIRRAGRRTRGATLYCTLEACSSRGKTPPCVEAIIRSGIKRAVFAMRDPNPVNYGGGIRRLKRAGVDTACGVLRDEAMELNRPFTKFIKKGLPYITIKLAQSLDGKTADSAGRSRWITSASSRRLVHRLRARSDAVLAGANTVIKDDPLLTNRGGGKNQPLRVILDTDLRIPPESRVIDGRKDRGRGALIIGGRNASQKKKRILEGRGARVVLMPREKNQIDLSRAMRYLAGIGVVSVLSEGGGELSASLLRKGLADEVFLFIAPRIIGGRNAPGSFGGAASDIRNSFFLKDMRMEKIGPDILVRGRL